MIFKRTLKRRIQGSMFKTAGITLLITLLIILPMIYVAVTPITTFISQTINSYILQNYGMNFDSDFEMIQKRQSKNIIENLSIEEIIQLYNESLEKTDLIQSENADLMKDMMSDDGLSISVDSLDESNQKLFIFSMMTVIRKIEELVPYKNTVLTEFNVNGKTVFEIPENYTPGSSTGIAHFEQMYLESNKSGYIDSELLSIYNDSKSVLLIYDNNSNVIGTITTAINPILIFLIMIPIILVFIVAGFIALFVAMLMSKLLSIPILRPIKLLNNQLSAIANDDFAFTKHTLVEVKRPPEEIKLLSDNSNIIMEKMKTYYDDLEEYKDELEAQNLELEAQNIELADSKKLIENQQDQLVQSEKMASIGQLSAAIAHEINTPLGAIKSNCQMIEMILPIINSTYLTVEDTKVKKAIKNLGNCNSISLDASNRMGEIIRNLKNFSRLDQSDYQDADINEGIGSVLVLTSNLWKNKVTINTNLDQLPLVSCYPSMLNQVFMNIIVNAIQASDNNGIIDISTRNDGVFIYVDIEDYGQGIPVGEIDHIFESGFTTKDKDKGTGLGLSISKDIITRHSGSIEVSSELGKGSKFIIKLPIKHEHSDS